MKELAGTLEENTWKRLTGGHSGNTCKGKSKTLQWTGKKLNFPPFRKKE